MSQQDKCVGEINHCVGLGALPEGTSYKCECKPKDAKNKKLY